MTWTRRAKQQKVSTPRLRPAAAALRRSREHPAEPFTFTLRDPGHGISFAIGEGDDGSPLLSYSVIHAFYQLPDGSKWAEHTDLYDVDDLRTAGKLAKLPFRQLTEGLRERELLAGTGRRHSNLDFAEFDFHVFTKVRGVKDLARGSLACVD